jgi:hypothetical protein
MIQEGDKAELLPQMDSRRPFSLSPFPDMI